MNATATFDIIQPDRRGRNGLSVGWGISLLAHAAILAWLLHAPKPRPPDVTPAARIEVRLAPAPPPAPAVPEAPARPAAEAAPAAPARSTSNEPAAAAPARTHPAPAAPTRAPAPAYMTAPAPARATPDTNEQPATPAASGAASDSPPTPSVDIASARQAARLIARESGKATVTLPARKPVVDPNADRAEPVDPIEAARRKDCKTAYAGAGLLAVIPLAIDAVRSAANDSGCKW